MQEQYGLQVKIEANGIATQFEDTLRILLYQAVRESLFNVVKHAGTLSATVTFEEADDQIQITVSDGGSGFPADTPGGQEKVTGGLMRIRHRLNLMGCTLQVRSQPEQGTQITIGVPSNQDND